jgi:lysozyme
MPPIIKSPPFIDISHWIEVPDFSKLVPMPWLIGTKATEGTAFLDPSYGLYSEEIRKVGARLLSYHFMNVSDPIKQADWFSEIVLQGELRPNELLACDMETTGVSLNAIKVFLDRVQVLTGIRPIIYSTELLLESLYPNGIPPTWLKNEWVWIAEYAGDPTNMTSLPSWIIPSGLTINNMAAWQYTDDGEYPGVPGNNVDLNMLNESYIQAMKLLSPDPQGDVPMETVLYLADLLPDKVSNVRSAPDLQSSWMGSLTGPLTVSIVSEKTVADGFNWYKINAPTNGYIAFTSSYANLRSPEDPTPEPTGDKPKKITIEMESGRIFVSTQFDEVV